MSNSVINQISSGDPESLRSTILSSPNNGSDSERTEPAVSLSSDESATQALVDREWAQNGSAEAHGLLLWVLRVSQDLEKMRAL